MLANYLKRSGWSVGRIVAGLAMVGLGVAVCSDAWTDILRIARKDEEASHILLVPVVFAWLFWVRQRRLRHCQPGASLMGPVLVLIGWMLYSIGDLRLIHYFWYGGAVILAVGCLVTVVGKDILIKFAPAFLCLVFLIPVPARLRQRTTVPMENASALVTQKAMDVLGMPVERKGNLLTINGVDVTINEACNGLRMVFTLVLVSYGFAFGTPLRNYIRVLILIASPISAILCNVLRLMPTVWVYGHASTVTAGRFHDIAGWVMLVISFLLLMGIIRLLRWALLPVSRFTLAYD